VFSALNNKKRIGGLNSTTGSNISTPGAFYDKTFYGHKLRIFLTG
jgi:hypothetical protein